MKTYDPKLYPFQSRWQELDGHKIHYIDEGQGEIIMFSHPPVSSSFMYRHMIQALKGRYRCIALDFPGFGLSTAANGYQYSIQSQAYVVSKFIAQLQLKGFYFVMQEIGGHAAISAIMQRPEDLKGIILTDTIIFPVSQYPKIRRILKIVNSGIFNFINSNFNLLIRLSTKSFGQRKLTKEERDTYIAMFDTHQKRRRITSLLYELVRQETLMQKIQHAFESTFSHTPALLVYGEKDALTGFGVPQRIKAMLPHAELHFIKGESHFPHEGAPEEISRIIEDWLG